MGSAFNKGKFASSKRGAGTNLVKSGSRASAVSGSVPKPARSVPKSSKRGAGTSIVR